jgi:subtilase family serine protease
MNICTLFQPLAARNRKIVARPLAIALLMGCAAPALAAEGPAVNRPFANAQDAGPVDAAMPMTATVWLKGRNEAQLDNIVADRYDPRSPAYHRWLSPDEVAGFGPAAEDVATMLASLQAQGLKVERVFDDGSAIRVSGTAGKVQAAFGTPIRLKQANGQVFFANTAKPQFQGAHAELIRTVSGLSSAGTRPFAAQQIDFATGLPRPGVPAATGTNPLASFTADCFGPDHTVKISGVTFSLIPGQSGAVSATYTGPSYLDPKTITRPACGYTAKQVVAHYGLDAVHARGWTGKGETIVIVDAFGSPTVQADANTFSQAMGLPALTDRNFQVVYPNGQPATQDSGWALETALDVEWAHALAPDARIVLTVAPSNDDAELAYAVQYAAQHRLGSVISNSWGQPEAGADPNTAAMYDEVFKRAAAEGISVNVATGDSGDNGVGTPVGAASLPADSPYATGIGGTSIDLPSDHGPVEAVWGITLSQLGQSIHPFPSPNIVGFLQGGGGGESVDFPKPRYQRQLQGAGRQLPDVSALGDPQTGAITVVTNTATGQQEYLVVGGTSLATPMFSAIWSLANQAAGESLGQAAPALGALPASALRDILPIDAQKINTTGTTVFRGTTTTSFDAAQLLGLDKTQPDGFLSALVFVGMVPREGYNDVGFGTDSSLRAGQGWDNATGYGVPNGVPFIEAARRLARRIF